MLRNFLSNDAQCWKVLRPLPPSRIHKALWGASRRLGMMGSQRKWRPKVGNDTYKQHPCHLFKNTFHSSSSKRIFDELGDSKVIQLSDNSLRFLPHPLWGSIKGGGNGERSSACDECQLLLLFMKLFWKGLGYRLVCNKVST